jgi:hypothetical protein
MGGLRTRTIGRVSKVSSRDLAIAGAVERIGMLTAKQIQVLSFSLDNYTACKRRLTKLHSYGILKRLPRSSVSDPYVYYVGRKLPPVSLLEHNLSVSEIYVRATRAAADLGWKVSDWQGPETLQALFAVRGKLAPDAYFKIQREVDGQPRTAGFFLECEHSVQAFNVLTHKLTRYADLFYSGRYTQIFNTRSMRVLVVYHSTQTTPSIKRVQQGLATARKTGVTLARFTTLETIENCSPIEMLTKPIWYKPDEAEPVSPYGLQE